MFYSEELKTPINSYNVKRLYGVNPDNDPEKAKAIGIYPLTEVPAGYAVSYYEKEASSYTAVPHCVTIAEQQMVQVIRNVGFNLGQVRVALGLPEIEPAQPIALNGYYPLYQNEADSDAASSNGESHTHDINGITYYMPDAGVTLYHGNYQTSTSSSSSSSSY